MRVVQIEVSQLWYLESLVFRIMERYKDMTEVMGLDYLMPIVDFFHGEVRLSVARRLLRVVSTPDVTTIRFSSLLSHHMSWRSL